MSSRDNMALVAPMPVTTHPQNSFGLRYHSSSGMAGRRHHSELQMTTSTGASSRSRTTSSGPPSSSRPPITSLEDIAAQLETRLSVSPSADFSCLDFDSSFRSEGYSVPLLKSRSLPNFNRHQLKSNISPKPPLRKAKSVRFADTQGLPLVAAVHQLTHRDSSYTENKIVPYDDQEDILSGLPLMIAAPRPSTIATATSSATTRNSPKIPRKLNSPCKHSVHKHTFTFTNPSLEPGFFGRVKGDYVVLESIREEPRSLHGIVRVFNLTYSKEVTVRWSHDGWRTSHDTCAVFCSNDGDTDRFAFELPINGDNVTFAIRYRTEEREFWDNNRGKNYTIISHLL